MVGHISPFQKPTFGMESAPVAVKYDTQRDLEHLIHDYVTAVNESCDDTLADCYLGDIEALLAQHPELTPEER